jgi:hypothetical protein
LGTTIRPDLSILSSMPLTMPYTIYNGNRRVVVRIWGIVERQA